MAEPEKKHNNFLYAVIMVLVVFVIVLLFLFANRPTGNTVNLGQENQEDNVQTQQQAQISCKDVQVPYDYLEEYQETVPYTDRECENQNLVYKVERGSCTTRKSHIFSADDPAEYSCTITNLDTEGGTFSMNIGFNIQGQQLKETQSKYIYPQSSETFSIQRDASVDSCFCSEIIPTKQVCRDVTRYQEVTKTRTVTRYRTEQKCE